MHFKTYNTQFVSMSLISITYVHHYIQCMLALNPLHKSIHLIINSFNLGTFAYQMNSNNVCCMLAVEINRTNINFTK